MASALFRRSSSASFSGMAKTSMSPLPSGGLHGWNRPSPVSGPPPMSMGPPGRRMAVPASKGSGHLGGGGGAVLLMPPTKGPAKAAAPGAGASSTKARGSEPSRCESGWSHSANSRSSLAVAVLRKAGAPTRVRLERRDSSAASRLAGPPVRKSARGGIAASGAVIRGGACNGSHATSAAGETRGTIVAGCVIVGAATRVRLERRGAWSTNISGAAATSTEASPWRPGGVAAAAAAEASASRSTKRSRATAAASGPRPTNSGGEGGSSGDPAAGPAPRRRPRWSFGGSAPRGSPLRARKMPASFSARLARTGRPAGSTSARSSTASMVCLARTRRPAGSTSVRSSTASTLCLAARGPASSDSNGCTAGSSNRAAPDCGLPTGLQVLTRGDWTARAAAIPALVRPL
mmetsp:Transcript_65220/g.201923  ORF Transcript_65220/g.201923 Transcript_65220/m.201923 type:complete len:405 (-) Transcript_65220:45-1259(-)